MHYLALIGSFIIWGLSPIYFKLLANIEHFELASYRIILSLIPMIFIIGLKNITNSFKTALNYPLKILLASTCMFINIFFFIYAVNSGHILQASFGYFLSPLLSILLAAIILKEKLSAIKIGAIILTLISIGIRLSDFETIPWISLALGLAFAIYGLLKKMVPMDTKSLTFVEMSLLIFPSIWILATTNEYTLLTQATSTEQLILLAVSIPTILPFILFNYGTQAIPLNIVGFIQYLSPTMQFLVAIFLYQEPLISTHLISFLFIWCACGMVAMNNIFRGKNARK